MTNKPYSSKPEGITGTLNEGEAVYADSSSSIVSKSTHTISDLEVTFKTNLTVGEDDKGHDVKFHGETSGSHMLWDQSQNNLKLIGAAGIIIPENKLVLGNDIVYSNAAELNILDGSSTAWTSWTPTLGYFTKGNNGTVSAKYVKIGKVVHWQFYFLGGSDSTFDTSGSTFRFSLPITPSSDLAYAPMGTGWLRPDKGSTIYHGTTLHAGSGSDALIYCHVTDHATINYAYMSGVKGNVPATWLTSGNFCDMMFSGFYRID